MKTSKEIAAYKQGLQDGFENTKEGANADCWFDHCMPFPDGFLNDVSYENHNLKGLHTWLIEQFINDKSSCLRIR